MKTCPSCSKEFEDNFNFCRNDGTALQTKALGTACAKCGKEIEPGKKFCRHCGTRLDLPSDPPPTKVEKPEVQERVTQPQGQAELLKPLVEEQAGKTIQTQTIQQQESVQGGLAKQESPVEAAERHLKEGDYKTRSLP